MNYLELYLQKVKFNENLMDLAKKNKSPKVFTLDALMKGTSNVDILSVLEKYYKLSESEIQEIFKSIDKKEVKEGFRKNLFPEGITYDDVDSLLSLKTVWDDLDETFDNLQKYFTDKEKSKFRDDIKSCQDVEEAQGIIKAMKDIAEDSDDYSKGDSPDYDDDYDDPDDAKDSEI